MDGKPKAYHGEWARMYIKHIHKVGTSDRYVWPIKGVSDGCPSAFYTT